MVRGARGRSGALLWFLNLALGSVGDLVCNFLRYVVRTTCEAWAVSVMIAGVLTVVVLPTMEGPYQPVRMPVFVAIALVCGKVQVDAPVGALSNADREQLKRRKLDLSGAAT